jgi:pimeloyl-ACP methyl ester carboxylesterase
LILVGDSIGGMYVLRFAAMYPDDVAAVLLVDGRPRGFTREYEAAGISLCGPPDALAMVLPNHVAAEARAARRQ